MVVWRGQRDICLCQRSDVRAAETGSGILSVNPLGAGCPAAVEMEALLHGVRRVLALDAEGGLPGQRQEGEAIAQGLAAGDVAEDEILPVLGDAALRAIIEEPAAAPAQKLVDVNGTAVHGNLLAPPESGASLSDSADVPLYPFHLRSARWGQGTSPRHGA